MLGKLMAGALVMAGIGGLSTAALAQSYGGITLSFGSGGYPNPYDYGYSYDPYAYGSYGTYGWEPFSYYDDGDDYDRFGFWSQQYESARDRWNRPRRDSWEDRYDRRWREDEDNDE